MELGERIMILGSSGSGKSTLASYLGTSLNIPVVHLDRLFWNAGWVETPKEEMYRKVEKAVSKDVWVIDGNYSSSVDMRLERTTTVIFIDLNRWLCLFRALKRWIKNYGKTREDMGEGCNEKIDLEFILWIWNYPKRSRGKVLRKISEFISKGNDIAFYHLKSKKEVRNFLKEIEW